MGEKENLMKIREKGKIRELFPWSGEICVFQIDSGNFLISRYVMFLQLFALAENLKDCPLILKGEFCNIMVSFVLLNCFDEMISKIAKKPLNVLY